MHRLVAAVALTLAASFGAHAATPSSASIEQLLEITQAQKLSAELLTQVDGMLKPMFEKALSQQNLNDEQRQQAGTALRRFQEQMAKVLKEELGWDRMKSMQVEIYSSTFSQEEIDGLISFYRSPTGQAFVEKMPLVMQKSMQLMQARMPALMERMTLAAKQSAEDLKKTAAAKR